MKIYCDTVPLFLPPTLQFKLPIPDLIDKTEATADSRLYGGKFKLGLSDPLVQETVARDSDVWFIIPHC
jgi:hypothetical protein